MYDLRRRNINRTYSPQSATCYCVVPSAGDASFLKLQQSQWIFNGVKTSYNFLLFHSSLSLLSVMHFQEWLRSLRSSAGIKGSESEDFWCLLPTLPVSSFSLSSLSLSPSSLLGLGALASLTAYWLVYRPRPMRPPCDLQAQSVAVDVSASLVHLRPEQRSSSQECAEVFDTVVLLQGDPSCRRSALLKDDSLLEFYYDDTRTFYDMFQRGLRIAGGDTFTTHFH